MIQHVGGGRVIDHGPQKPYRGSREIIGGIGIGNAVVSANQHENLRGVSALSGHQGTPRPKRYGDMTEQQVERLREKNREYRARFRQNHGTGKCECHITYGGQIRLPGYLERERDRSRLRRELRRAAR